MHAGINQLAVSIFSVPNGLEKNKLNKKQKFWFFLSVLRNDKANNFIRNILDNFSFIFLYQSLTHSYVTLIINVPKVISNNHNFFEMCGY